jgi:hypothetical protein
MLVTHHVVAKEVGLVVFHVNVDGSLLQHHAKPLVVVHLEPAHANFLCPFVIIFNNDIQGP